MSSTDTFVPWWQQNTNALILNAQLMKYVINDMLIVIECGKHKWCVELTILFTCHNGSNTVLLLHVTEIMTIIFCTHLAFTDTLYSFYKLYLNILQNHVQILHNIRLSRADLIVKMSFDTLRCLLFHGQTFKSWFVGSLFYSIIISYCINHRPKHHVLHRNLCVFKQYEINKTIKQYKCAFEQNGPW